uniref:Glycosyl hydrolase family 13 catalytic domain-containing protein n=1 Tax=Clastoptera arizonana TaxID=38151 RepID=A0A1B6CHZ3_9HEMI
MALEPTTLVNSDNLFGVTVSAPSPEFLLADEESSFTYPLLTPSPPAEFDHPLAIDTRPVIGYERQLSPSSIDTDLSSIPTLSSNAPTVDYGALGNSMPCAEVKEDNQVVGNGQCQELKSGLDSSSSSSSVLQDTTACAQLLNPHHYLNLANDSNCQENGGIKPGICGITLGVNKSPQDFAFISWNWPLIRKFCFWGVMSLIVACVCIVIAYITTLPVRCDPPRSWYQGSLIYEVFPGSFQDSNVDGVGDLKGMVSKIDYFETIGVRAVRLNSIFQSEHYPEHYDRVENLTKIDSTLGTMAEFQFLVNSLHKRNISIILDVPLFPFLKHLTLPESTAKHWNDQSNSGDSKKQSHHIILNNHVLNSSENKSLYAFNITHSPNKSSFISSVLEFWLETGVDGFYMKGLERFISDEKFQEEIQHWRKTLNKHKRGLDKVLICSENLLKVLENTGTFSSKLSTVLTHFSLVEYQIDISKELGDQINYVQKSILFSKPGYPWPMWSLGGAERPRLASRLNVLNGVSAILLEMMLPGTPSLFYGDELGLDNIHDPDGEIKDLSHIHQLSPMKWSKGDFSTTLPWLPKAISRVPEGMNKLVYEMSVLRENTPSIYMNAVWKESTLILNCDIRYNDGSILVIERSYPRRHSYIVIINFSSKKESRDLSSIYYGGTVVMTTGKHTGYVSFQNMSLYPGEAVIIKLDK